MVATELARLDMADWLAATSTTMAPHLTPVDHVTIYAEAMAKRTWPVIAKAIREEPALDPSAVRLALARHVWCDLLIGLICVIDRGDIALKDIGDAAGDVEQAILGSSMRSGRDAVTSLTNQTQAQLAALFVEWR